MVEHQLSSLPFSCCTEGTQQHHHGDQAAGCRKQKNWLKQNGVKRLVYSTLCSTLAVLVDGAVTRLISLSTQLHWLQTHRFVISDSNKTAEVLPFAMAPLITAPVSWTKPDHYRDRWWLEVWTVGNCRVNILIWMFLCKFDR